MVTHFDLRLQSDHVIGIVGGMGPESGVALINSIVRQTGAASDQQHLSTILVSLPSYIVDRTLFLEGRVKENPAFNVAKIIRLLEQAGADVVGIACNTCHAPPIFDVILEQLEQQQSKVRLLHMPRETCRLITENYPFAKRIGVMSTNGSYRAGVYSHLLHRMGYELILPPASFQDQVIHRMIYDPENGIKSNPGKLSSHARCLADEAVNYFKENGADTVILGCTELSLILNDRHDGDMRFVDSTDAMARALIREANEPIGEAMLPQKQLYSRIHKFS